MKSIAIQRSFVGLALSTTLLAVWAGAQERANIKSAESVQYCELVRSPEKYDGKRVTVRAVYNYGFEWQELLCLECREKGKTWLQFGFDTADRVRRDLKRAPRHQGVVIGNFTGVFHGGGGPYGDGGYRYSFDVEAVDDLKVLARDMKTSISEVGVCGATSSRKTEIRASPRNRQ